jgi:hypothetical protein
MGMIDRHAIDASVSWVEAGMAQIIKVKVV